MLGVRKIRTNQDSEWDNAVLLTGNYEFYHLCKYHQIAQANGEGEPILFVCQDDSQIVAFPFLERKDLDFKDLTSVYGYPGPVVSKNVTTEFLSRCSRELYDFLSEEGYISAFSRLNGFYFQNQSLFLGNIGKIERIGQTIVLDLSKPYNTIFSGYRKGHKHKIKKMRRYGEIYDDKNFEHVDIFVDMYYENMKRVGAEDSYFFPKSYFEKIIEQQHVETKLFFIKSEGEFLAGALFLGSNGIVQYHLSATRKEFLKESPMNMLLDEAIKYFKLQGYRKFHFGGGRGNGEDSLYNFKAGFSKETLDFYVWKYIPDLRIYRKAAEQLDVQVCEGQEYEGFFPVYRRSK